MANPDSLAIAQNLQLARIIVYNQPDTAFALIRPTLAASKKIGKELYAEACNTMGIYLDVTGKPQQALHMYTTGLNALKDVDKPSQTAGILSNIGLIYWSRNALDTALMKFTEAAELYRKDGNAGGMGNVYSNIGLVYKKDKQVTEAITYFQKALQAQLSQNDSQSIARTYGNLGMMYNIKMQVDTANRYYQVALQYFGDNVRGASTVYQNMAIGLQQAGKTNRALEYGLKALKLRNELGDPGIIAASQRLLGQIYANLNQPKEALNAYEQALSHYRGNRLVLEEYKLYEKMAGLSTKLGLHQNASKYWQRRTLLSDSLFKAQTSKQLADLQLAYQSEYQQRLSAEKDRDLAQIERDDTLKYAFIVGLILLIVGIAGVLFFIMRMKKMNAQQTFLREQVQLSREVMEHLHLQLLKVQNSKGISPNEKETLIASATSQLDNSILSLKPDLTANDLEKRCFNELEKLPKHVKLKHSTRSDFTQISARVAEQVIHIVQTAVQSTVDQTGITTVEYQFHSTAGAICLELCFNASNPVLVRTKPDGGMGLAQMVQNAQQVELKLDIEVAENHTRLVISSEE